MSYYKASALGRRGDAFMISFIKNQSANNDVDIIPLSFPDSMNEIRQRKPFSQLPMPLQNLKDYIDTVAMDEQSVKGLKT